MKSDFKVLKRYGFQESYHDYKEQVPNPLSWDEYQLVKHWLANINREIFMNHYEWKLPFFLGYIRISINERGTFYWKWDRTRNSMHLPKAGLWGFEPVEGKLSDLGEYGLHHYITKCNNDPKLPKYAVIKKRRRRIDITFDEFQESLK